MIPCGKSELLLFDELPVQSSMTSSTWVDYHSVSDPKSSTQLEFVIPGSQDEYVDFNDTKLYLELQLQKQPAAAVVGPVNLLLNSLFADVAVQLNDVTIQGAEPYYPYKAMLESLLLFDRETKQTQLAAAGYVEDLPGKHNDAATNTSHTVRATWLNQTNKVLELCGPLHVDLATQPRYLLPRVDIRVRLVRTAPEFYLNCWSAGQDALQSAQIVINKALLFVRKVRVLASVLQGHEQGLQQSNAIYPVQHVSMDSHTVSDGQLSFTKENLFQGRMPKFVVVCMVRNDAFVGDYKQNPFNFQHFDVSYCGLFRDGESIPERTPYEMPSEAHMTRAYLGMFHALELYNRNESNGITLDAFRRGSTLFVFNLTPDLAVGAGGGGCQQAYRSGNLRLDMKFRQALPQAINVIYYGVFDGKVEITKDRNIYLDYL